MTKIARHHISLMPTTAQYELIETWAHEIYHKQPGTAIMAKIMRIVELELAVTRPVVFDNGLDNPIDD